MCITCVLFAGIEEIGVQIEEPFKLLPLEDIVHDIEREVLATAGSMDHISAVINTSLEASATPLLHAAAAKAGAMHLAGSAAAGAAGAGAGAGSANGVTANGATANGATVNGHHHNGNGNGKVPAHVSHV